jgi:hypothetical protein
MIRLNESLWIGDSSDEKAALLHTMAGNIYAVLNVAHDLVGTWNWGDEVEYMQVGLIDGPGNPLSAYCAAVLALHSLLKRGKVLVCCHTRSRAMAVALMYLHLTGGRGWDGRLELIREYVDIELPVPNAAHRAAFDKINWKALGSLLGD